MSQHRAVFLDRDGTMIEDVGYLDRLERLSLFPYTIDAVRLLNASGYKVVVVTSQNGVANGILTEEFLAEAHAPAFRQRKAQGHAAVALLERCVERIEREADPGQQPPSLHRFTMTNFFM